MFSQTRSFRLAMIMLLALPSVCLANNFLLEDYPAMQTTFTYRYQRPNFKQDADIDLLNGFHELSLQAPLGGRVALVALLPLAHFGLGGNSRSDGESAVGNFYLGARWGEHEDRGNTGFSAGVYLPTADKSKDQASYMGYISGSHWPQSFVSDILTLHTNVLYRYNNPSGLYISGEIGPEAYIYTGGGGGDSEFALRYGIGSGFDSKNLSVGMEIAGYWALTDDTDQLSDAMFHMVSVGGEYHGSVVSPGLYYSIPTNRSYTKFLDGVLGIRVRVSLN